MKFTPKNIISNQARYEQRMTSLDHMFVQLLFLSLGNFGLLSLIRFPD